jgi:surface polysaccharide O-acyltransferase-like enzyme
VREENILFYFSGYAGYFVLGYYLNNNAKNIICSKKISFCMGVGLGIVFLPPVLCKVNHWNIDFYSLFWYLSIGVVVMCAGWFLLLYSIPLFQKKNRVTDVFSEISRISFGIYLIHIFIMRNILWNWEVLQSLSYNIQIFVCALLTFALSYLVAKVISKLPFSKYIIGC